MVALRVLFVFFFFFFIWGTSLLAKGVLDYVKETQKQRLWEKRQWRLLLYYKKCKISSFCSTVEDSFFFESPRGFENPELELLATLRGFYKKPSVHKITEHSQCKFPARFHWLKNQLKLEFLPKVICKKLIQFREKMESKSLSLFYASQDLAQPAALFGHTFIKFNQNKSQKLNDPTVSFLGNPAENEGVIPLVYKGLTGGYTGNYVTIPFRKVHEKYTTIHNRNLWELKLTFSPKQISFLIDHLWEVQKVSYKYYFLDDNCAYYNIYLLDVMKPSLGLTQDYIATVLPTETIKNLTKREGLLKSAHFYPSNVTMYKQLYLEKLTQSEREAFIEFEKSGKIQSQQTEPTTREDMIFSTAWHYTTFQLFKNISNRNELKKHAQNYKYLANLRKKKKIPLYYQGEPDYTNPSLAHPPGAIHLYSGFGRGSWFSGISYNFKGHEQIDSPLGYLPFSELIALQANLRFYIKDKTLELTQFKILSMRNFLLVEAELFPLSWGIDIGLKTISNHTIKEVKDSISFNKEISFYLEVDMGYTLPLHFMPGNFVLYSLVNALSDFALTYNYFIGLGYGVETGTLWYITDIWIFKTELKWRHLFISDISPQLVLNLGMNVTLADSFAIESYYAQNLLDTSYELILNLKFYL